MNPLRINSLVIPYKLVIDNKHMYSNCLKRRYKYVNSLKMQYIPLNQRNRCHLKPMRRYLTKLARNLAYTRNLCLREFIFCARDFFGKEVLYITKLFSKLQGLSLPILHRPKGQLKSNIIWLKSLKFLKRLSCVNEQHASWVYSEQSIVGLYKKFASTLKRKKLDSLELDLKKEMLMDIKSQIFTGFSSTLKILRINLEDFDVSTFQENSLKSWSFLTNLKQLKELYLFTPVPPVRLNQILSSISCPEHIRSLGFACRHEKNNITIQEDYKELEKTMKKFRTLQQVTLKFSSLPDDLKAFDELKECTLKCLRIEARIQGYDDITRLAEFIGEFKHLQEFDLKLSWSFVCQEMQQIDFLFGKIAKLETVRRLDLCFLPYENQKHSIHFSRSFKWYLYGLSNLEEVSFEFAQAGIASLAFDVINELQKCSDKIRKLKVNLQGEKIKKQTFIKLLQVCKSVRLLQELIFEDIYLEYENDIHTFVDIFIQMENLETLKLLKLKSENDRTLAFIVEEMMQFKGLKEIECVSNSNSEWNYDSFTRTRIEESSKSNSSFRSIVVPKNSAYYMKNIKVLKWN